MLNCYIEARSKGVERFVASVPEAKPTAAPSCSSSHGEWPRNKEHQMTSLSFRRRAEDGRVFAKCSLALLAFPCLKFSLAIKS
jgi:hypothetical protein